MQTTKKTFAIGEVKAAESENPSGEFEVILSAETLDRDGEIIDAKAFEPLPESIPFHAFHDFHDPIGRGVPFYDGDILKARGTFASTPRAQEIRTLVSEGVIGHTSVGFMAATRKGKGDDATPHVTSGELLEGSFVSVPSNRDAAVLAAKEFESKAGARNSAKDSERIQSIHDLAVSNGATCDTDQAHQVSTEEAPVTPAKEAGKSPASADVVAAFRIRGRAALLAVGEATTKNTRP
jgi:HK97 family phage prohead protease